MRAIQWQAEHLTRIRDIIRTEDTRSPRRVWQAFQRLHPEQAERLCQLGIDERAIRRLMLQRAAELGLDLTSRLGVGESLSNRRTMTAAEFARHEEAKREYSRLWMSKKRQQQPTRPTVRTPAATGRPKWARGEWKGGKRVLPPRVEAVRERRVQTERSGPEIERRVGLPLWDAEGKARAEQADHRAADIYARRHRAGIL